MIEELDGLITRHGLSRVRKKIHDSVAPAIRLRKTGRSDRPFSSRFGGAPDLIDGTDWPTHKGRTLTFLCQIECAYLPAPRPTELPANALLSFFYDPDGESWGFDPADRGAGVVIFQPDNRGSNVCYNNNVRVLPEFGMTFEHAYTLPPEDSVAMAEAGFDFSKDERMKYFDLHLEFDALLNANSPLHQILGHPLQIQNDMQIECELTSRGINCGDSKPYAAPDINQKRRAAADWRLLCQIDSDQALDIMWGDVGMLYFWIRRSDLLENRFDRTWTILQCS